MARNQVQCQKGLSEAELETGHGSEKKCRAAIIAWRWRESFVYPTAWYAPCSILRTRRPIEGLSVARSEGDAFRQQGWPAAACADDRR